MEKYFYLSLRADGEIVGKIEITLYQTLIESDIDKERYSCHEPTRTNETQDLFPHPDWFKINLCFSGANQY